MHQIATLSLSKIYELSGVDLGLAVKILTGRQRFSAPVEVLSDMQFREELRALVPPKAPRHNHHQVYQASRSALAHAEKAVQHASSFFGRMTASQKLRLENKARALLTAIGRVRSSSGRELS